MNRRTMLFTIGLSLLPAGCGDSTGPSIATLEISPASATLVAIGGTVQFTAVPRDVAGNLIPSGGFVWLSSNVQVATVNEARGLATAVANGNASISASSPSLLGQSGSATLTVTIP